MGGLQWPYAWFHLPLRASSSFLTRRKAMEFYLGQVVIFAGNFAPRGWLLCNGQLVQIQQNMALFSILGTTYGGDGQKTFALPNIPAVKAENGAQLNYLICAEGVYPSRD
jgi:microcystin-dependent protein